MKKQMNFKTATILGVLIGSLALTVWAAAISKTKWSPANGVTSITGAPAVSQTFTFLNTNAAVNSTVLIYDMPGTNPVYTIGAYTNIAMSAGYFTNLWTNYYGVLNSNIETVLIYTTSSVASASTAYPLIGIYTVSSNTSPGSGTLTVNLTYAARYGIGFTNDNPVTMSVLYQQ